MCRCCQHSKLRISSHGAPGAPVEPLGKRMAATMRIKMVMLQMSTTLSVIVLYQRRVPRGVTSLGVPAGPRVRQKIAWLHCVSTGRMQLGILWHKKGFAPVLQPWSTQRLQKVTSVRHTCFPADKRRSGSGEILKPLCGSVGPISSQRCPEGQSAMS